MTCYNNWTTNINGMINDEKLISQFLVGHRKILDNSLTDWNYIMILVEAIEKIIGHNIDIGNITSIYWWYSPKITGIFPKGNGGGGGGSMKRDDLFEPIFGKYYSLEFHSKTKIEAVQKACVKWIKWYNKNSAKT